MEISRGYLSPYFINNDNLTCELADCFILITDQIISNVKLIIPVLEKTAQAGRPILFIASNVEGTALITLIQNKMGGRLKCCAVKAPYFGNNQRATLEDIAAVTGGIFVSKELDMSLEHITLNDLGKASRVVITKDTCTIIGGEGTSEAIKQRIDYTKQQLSTIDSDFEIEKTQERLARLVGGVIVLNIGAATETELKEKKARVEDALHATRAAVEEGIVPGGGVAYMYASVAVENLQNTSTQRRDIEAGYRIVQEALKAPLFQICKNAGLTPEIILEHILKGGSTSYGYNVVMEEYGDLFELGVIDPTKVAVYALQNAASVAGMLLTLDAVVVDEPTDNNQNAAGGPPMPMSGMPPGMV
jgi:chaperonin GroEL